MNALQQPDKPGRGTSASSSRVATTLEADTTTISVIIPTYNRSRLLQRAVQSVLAQNMGGLEIIVVDDASTEDIPKALRQLPRTDIIYVKHNENRGAAAARNTGLKHATGKYIAFLDSDDVWLPGKLQRQLEVFQIGPENLGLVYTGFQQKGRQWHDHSMESMKLHGNIADEILVKNYIGTTSTPLIKRVCFDTVGGFDETLTSCQDWDMWVRIAQCYEVECIREDCVVYERQRDSITSNKNLWLYGRKIFLKKYATPIKNMPWHLKSHHYFYLGRSFRRRALWQSLWYFLQSAVLHPVTFIHLCTFVFRKL